MSSVVDKIADLALSPIQQEARDRLEQVELALREDGTSSTSHGPLRLSKLSALVDLDLFTSVIDFANVQTYPDELGFLAYAYYRLGNLSELRELVGERGSDKTPVSARLALAQAEYKHGNVEAARSQFENCRNGVVAEDENDIDVNLSAINALDGLVNSSNSSSFDGVFNHAYALLVRGSTSKALELLQQANGLAEEDDDRQAAVAQAAYAHLIAGDREEALKLLESLSSSSTQLPNAINLVSLNNKLSATYNGGDVFAAHKALLNFDDFSKKRAMRELNANQRQIIQRNQLKLLARVGISGTTRRAKRHQAEFAHDVEPLSLAYHFLKSAKSVSKLAHSGDIAAKICLAASEDKEWRYPANKELKQGDFGSLATAASLALTETPPSSLKNFFESLNVPELNSASENLLNPKAEVSENTLSSIDGMISSLDASLLDTTLPSNNLMSTSTVKPTTHKKRSGKRKLPASFDPEKEPNPERWLAKQDRSDYKPKKKKTSQATQGAANVPEEQAAPSTSQVVGAKSSSKKKNKKKGKK